MGILSIWTMLEIVVMQFCDIYNNDVMMFSFVNLWFMSSSEL